MTDFTCFVAGKPRPKGRPRRGRNGHFYTPKATAEWEETVAWSVRAAMGGKQPFVGPIELNLHFVGANPLSDTDNLAKALLDGCNGVLYHDDRQIDVLYAERGVVGEPGVLITLTVLATQAAVS